MFSVVVPLWNNRETIAAAIDSALAQTYRDFELIVVDDGATDGSPAIVAGYDDPRIRMLAQDNAGAGAARNAGMAAARADWIAFLDADDLWLPDHLAELDRLRADFPEAGLIGTSYIQGWPDGRYRAPRARAVRHEEINYFERVAAGEHVLWTSSAAVPRRNLETVGDFGSGRMGEDTRYWLRIALELPVAVSTRRTAVYRTSPNGLTAAAGHRWRGRPLRRPADVSHRVAFLLDRYARARPELRRGIDLFVDQDFRWCLRASARIGDLATIRALAPLFPRPPRGLDRLLLAAARLPDAAARLFYRAGFATAPPFARLFRRLRI
jgi:glycosyltransferase involved in cell wall biosynthesis